MRIDVAIREYGLRYREGDRAALDEFKRRFGRAIQIILARIIRSRQARSRFERSVLWHLKHLSRSQSWPEINRTLVHRICEALLTCQPSSQSDAHPSSTVGSTDSL